MTPKVHILCIIFLIFFSCQLKEEKVILKKGDTIDFETFSKSEIYFSNLKYIILLVDYADYKVTERPNYKLIVCNKKMEFVGMSNNIRYPICLNGDTLICNKGENIIKINRSNLPKDLIIRIDSYGEGYRTYGRRKFGFIKQIYYDKCKNDVLVDVEGGCMSCITEKDTTIYFSLNTIHCNENCFANPSMYIISYDSTYLEDNIIKFYMEGTKEQFLDYRKQVWNSFHEKCE